MSIDQLQALLQTPLALFIVMLLASLASALKQIKDTTLPLSSYLAHWPETVAAVIANVLGFLVLVETDTLNLASALGLGWMSNSAVDLLRTGGRSAAVAAGNKQSGFARPGALLALVVVGLVGASQLQGCSLIGTAQPQTFNQRFVYVVSQVAAVRVTTANALDAGQITPETGRYVLDLTDRARGVLELANAAQAAGQADRGALQLTLALGILTELQRYLAQEKLPHEPTKHRPAD